MDENEYLLKIGSTLFLGGILLHMLSGIFILMENSAGFTLQSGGFFLGPGVMGILPATGCILAIAGFLMMIKAIFNTYKGRAD